VVRTQKFRPSIAFSGFPARATHPGYQEHRNRSSRHKVTAVQSYEIFEKSENLELCWGGLSFNPGPHCRGWGEDLKISVIILCVCNHKKYSAWIIKTPWKWTDLEQYINLGSELLIQLQKLVKLQRFGNIKICKNVSFFDFFVLKLINWFGLCYL